MLILFRTYDDTSARTNLRATALATKQKLKNVFLLQSLPTLTANSTTFPSPMYL